MRTNTATNGTTHPTARRFGWLAVGAAGLIIGGLAAAVWAQPKRGVGVTREVAVPPGSYTGIVIGAYGGKNSSSWAAELVVGNSVFPINTRGGEMETVHFPGGWTAPSGTIIRLSPDAPSYVMFAWGIGPNGPVDFPKIK